MTLSLTTNLENLFRSSHSYGDIESLNPSTKQREVSWHKRVNGR